MTNVLFVCTGNSCRSVMAEGYFKKFAGDRLGKEWTVSSAGIGAMDGYPATELAIQVMAEEGVDVTGHQARQLTAEIVKEADRIYALERMHQDWILQAFPDAAKKVYLVREFASDFDGTMSDLDVPDPIQMPGEFYRSVSEMIRDCVKNIVTDLEMT